MGDKSRVSYGGGIRAGFHMMAGFHTVGDKSRVSYGGGGGGGGDKSRVSYGVWGDKPKKVFALYPTLIEHEWMG